MIGQLLPYAALVLYLMKQSEQPLTVFGIQSPWNTIDWTFAGLALTIYLLLMNPLSATITGIFGSPIQSVSFPVPQSSREIPIFMLEMLVIGFVEELVWRSYLQTRFRQVLKSSWQAVLATSVLFGAMHLYQGITGVVCATFFGVLFGSLFEWRRSIIPIAIMHAAVDFWIGIHST